MDGIWKENSPELVQENEGDQLLSTPKKNYCLRWMSLLAGGLAHAMLASNLIFYVYINDIKAKFHYNQTEVELFASMLNAGIGLGFLPNLIGSKLKSTWILVIGLLLSTAGLLLLWSSTKMVAFYEGKSWLMALYFLISGLGGSVAYIMALRFNATHFAEDKRGRIMAMMFIFIDIGMISFTVIYYKALPAATRLEGFLIVVVSFNAAVYIFCMIFLRNTPSNIGEITVAKEEPHSSNFKYEAMDTENALSEKSFSELLCTIDYQLLAWMCSSAFAVSLLLSNNMTVLTKELDLTSIDTVITIMYPPIVIVAALVFSLASDKLKHTLTRTSFLIAGVVCLAISSILNAFLSSGKGVVITAVVLAAVGTGIVYTIGPTAMSEVFHIDNLMRNWGLVMLLRAVLIIILHLIFGEIYDLEVSSDASMFCKGLHCTRYGYLLTFGVAVIAVGLGIILIIRNNLRNKRTTEM
ncbi:uncharacterized protein LOC127729044 isoform X1 [Mytilus californianus]|uniref:uncharacterized protein LOC127729044 isoform X1 n=1 Tax=Mytilus californianus TaxID=6549 RepID=UPI0022451059|nr:uncharacterized protein LOC127729044 isoform X1 [Mytilus californianus]